MWFDIVMCKLALTLILLAMLDVPASCTNTLPHTLSYRKSMVLRIMQNWDPRNCGCPIRISVVIARDGTLTNKAILDSSGRRKCDTEVLRAVTETEFEPLPKWYKGGPLEFKLTLDPAVQLHTLATQSFDAGEYAEAERLFKLALKVKVGTLGPNERYTAGIIYGYAQLLRRTNRSREADQLEAQAASSGLK
jgi:TonB family protein